MPKHHATVRDREFDECCGLHRTAPLDEPVSEARHWFCNCGVHGAFTFIWDDGDLVANRDRFRELQTRTA